MRDTDIEYPLLEDSNEEIGFAEKSCRELKKSWRIAGPVVFARLCQFSVPLITQAFVGHVGNLELAAYSIQRANIAGIALGVMLGMGSALETLCGQTYGAGQSHMLGVYLQRSWIILNCTALLFIPIYVFATPILKLLGQNDEVAELTGKIAIWLLPQLFFYTFNFPMQKFLQAQSKVMVVAFTCGGVVILHTVLSWLIIFKLGWGLIGAAIVLDFSLWLIAISLFLYIVFKCPSSWKGFSWLAFKDLWSFVQLSCSSAVMLCLEFWYLQVLLFLAGHMSDAQIAVDSLSICLSINSLEFMIHIALQAAISVRVSNELGAGQANAARFSVLMVTLSSIVIGIAVSIAVFLTRNLLPLIFTSSQEVIGAVKRLIKLLSVTILFNSIQPVLSGVAIGAGWQAIVAYVNIGSYYAFGVPLGCLLGYYFDIGVEGIWMGMIGGTALQTIILVIMIHKTDWNKEVSQARIRMKRWGGSSAQPSNDS